MVVVCDSAAHPKGRTAIVAEIAGKPGHWGVSVNNRRSPYGKRSEQPVNTATFLWPDSPVPPFLWPIPACKLCRRQLPLHNRHLSAALDTLAASGAATITLAEIASSIGNQEQR